MRGTRRHPLDDVDWHCSGEEMARQQITPASGGSAAAAMQPAVWLSSLTPPLPLSIIPSRADQLENPSSGWKKDKMHEGKSKTQISVNNLPGMNWSKMLLLITLILKESLEDTIRTILSEHFNR